jgi:hypothetical protein
MNTRKIEDLLMEGINMMEEEYEETSVSGLRTFDEAGILTLDAGIVINMDDGSEFQITIVQSK